MNKTAIKNFAVWARQKLISEITYKAGLIGISEKGISTPLPTSTDNIQFFDIGTGKPTEIANEEVKQRAALVSRIKEKEKTSDYKTAFQFVVEEAAYTWFNRLVAIRFMEVNEYLPSKIRVLSSEMQGKAEPDMVTTPFDTDMEFSAYETDRIMQLKDENKLDELFRMLFIKQCNKLNEVLPELFEKISDYTEYLLNISFTDKDGIVSHLVNDIEEKNFTEAVEIIGWLYQYYNTEPKEQVFANLKKNIKISKDNIPAATQLFTPDWIVRYMVENSLGRLWVEGHENDSLKAKWNYYLDEAEQEESVKAELKKIRADYKNIKLEEIKLIDPCMGSGHILVYAFDVFMQIYESQGYTERDAAQSIIENNIYGLDIDERAYQLAYFALMMKARQYDRRFLTREIAPQVYCPKGYAEGEEYGSLLNVDNLEEKPKDLQVNEQASFDSINYKHNLNTWNFRRLLNQKYDVVVTNPPYMTNNSMPPLMKKFVNKQYEISKRDLYSCFISKCQHLSKENGFYSLVTIQTWMFLSSFEELREKILKTNTFINMLHLGAGAFEELNAFNVLATAFCMRNMKFEGASYLSKYIRLVDYVTGKEVEFENSENYFMCEQKILNYIPGKIFLYWLSSNMKNVLVDYQKISDYYKVKPGMTTSDNAKFVRLWYEVENIKLKFGCKNIESSKESKGKWFPYNKGGNFRKWYGNNEYVVDWENDGYNIKNYKLLQREKDPKYNIGIAALNDIFKKGLTYSIFGFENFAIRYKDFGFLFDVSGASIFLPEDQELYLLAYLCSNVAFGFLKAIAPTVNFQAGNILDVPYKIDENIKPEIDAIAQECIDISREDWDDFEESWDFKTHPLIKFNNSSSLVDVFSTWNEYANERYAKLKNNEERINQLFISSYNLYEDITPEVVDRDIALREADLTRDIKSFVSYAVGCMFGRYSLDVDGLAYAGGDWDVSKYQTFIPDIDNVIPITDEEYFTDDIVGLFVAFVKKVYGAETLEENLDFIAKALGNKGDTSREVIRNYFVKDFYKDHVKTYQKRPIYWLYDSGKANGFKALIYMHRYNSDTTGKVRVDYLHKMQRTYMSEIERMQDMIDNSTNPREVAQSEKRKEKLIKQLKETKDYDEKIAHLALSRIAIDLDDGVKVNYEKVQTGQDGKKFDILGKI